MMIFDPSNPQELPSFSIEISIPSRVDFCVWLLELDGLQMSPFDRHPDGNRVLRDNGMDAKSWASWVKKIVLLSDGRLSGNLIQELQKGAPQSYLNWYRNEYLPNIPQSHLDFQIEQFKKALAAAVEVCSTSEAFRLRYAPVTELWDWEQSVRGTIEELYKHYQTSAQSERQNLCLKLQDDWGSQDIWEALQPYHEELERLNIELVVYAQPVEYLVPPVSVIVSVSEDPKSYDPNTFRERVVQAAANLVSLNSQGDG